MTSRRWLFWSLTGWNGEKSWHVSLLLSIQSGHQETLLSLSNGHFLNEVELMAMSERTPQLHPRRNSHSSQLSRPWHPKSTHWFEPQNYLLNSQWHQGSNFFSNIGLSFLSVFGLTGTGTAWGNRNSFWWLWFCISTDGRQELVWRHQCGGRPQTKNSWDPQSGDALKLEIFFFFFIIFVDLAT